MSNLRLKVCCEATQDLIMAGDSSGGLIQWFHRADRALLQELPKTQEPCYGLLGGSGLGPEGLIHAMAGSAWSTVWFLLGYHIN